MKKLTADESRGQTITDSPSTADSFLAWLSMPELGTPVHGPATRLALLRNGRRAGPRPKDSTRSFSRR